MPENSTYDVNPSAKYRVIETQYKGFLFRSRLEARWAVFFDSIGLEWKYETEGYEVSADGETFRYLPDFYLPQSDLYVEVKGSIDALLEDSARLSAMVRHGPMKTGLVLLGDIPEKTTGTVLHWILKSNDAGQLESSSCLFCCSNDHSFVGLLPNRGAWLLDSLSIPRVRTDPEKLWNLEPRIITANLNRLGVIPYAYDQARQARFEHGETPQVYNQLSGVL